MAAKKELPLLRCQVCDAIIPKESNRNWNQYYRKKYCSRPCSAKAHSRKVKILCEYCGKSIKRSPSHARSKHIYCSRKCRHLAATIPFKCPICGKEGRKPRSQLFPNGQRHIYCSKKCADIGLRIDKSVLKCDFCGQEFERYPCEIKKAIERGYRFVFCSHKCRAAMIANQFEPQQPFSGEHTSEPRNGYQTRVWRKAVKERDNFICQDCGKKDVMTVAHHIKPYTLYPELRWEISNGITLCYNCHEKRHSAPSHLIS